MYRINILFTLYSLKQKFLLSWQQVTLHLMKKGLSFRNRLCSFLFLMVCQEVFLYLFIHQSPVSLFIALWRISRVLPKLHGDSIFPSSLQTSLILKCLSCVILWKKMKETWTSLKSSFLNQVSMRRELRTIVPGTPEQTSCSKEKNMNILNQWYEFCARV